MDCEIFTATRDVNVNEQCQNALGIRQAYYEGALTVLDAATLHGGKLGSNTFRYGMPKLNMFPFACARPRG